MNWFQCKTLRTMTLAVVVTGTLAITQLPTGDISFWEERERAAFNGMDALVDAKTGLPVDIGSATTEGVKVKDAKTSPTNIGLLIATIVAERDQGRITKEEAERILTKIVDILEKMVKYKAFFFNWYNLADLNEKGAPKVGAPTVGPEAQQFISSVDNANLTVAMMAAVAAFPDSDISRRFKALIDAQNYGFFFHLDWRDWPRINHGFFVDRGTYSPFDYGTFMTEARLLVLLAILKGDAPEAHPKFPGMRLGWWGWVESGYMEAIPTICEKKSGEKIVTIASWGGSLFEELFPDLFLDEKTHSEALAENHRRTVGIHIDNADPTTGLWGWSPSETVDGIYKEAGVPCLGSGGLYPIGDVSPYSVLLAARYAPEKAVETLKKMEALNPSSYGPGFGYRDVISRDGRKVGPNILSLDKGMETIALFNFVQELKGRKGLSQYFWRYMDNIGRSEKGRQILRELRFDGRFYTYKWQPNAIPPNQPINIFEVFNRCGIGGGVRGSMNGVPDWSQISCSLRELRYDVTPQTSFAYYTALSLEDGGYRKPMKISQYNAFKIRFRGGEQFPASFKIELKQYTHLFKAFLVENVTNQWQEAIFRVYGDLLGAIDEVTVSIEHHRAKIGKMGSLVGTLYLEKMELVFSEEHNRDP